MYKTEIDRPIPSDLTQCAVTLSGKAIGYILTGAGAMVASLSGGFVCAAAAAGVSSELSVNSPAFLFLLAGTSVAQVAASYLIAKGSVQEYRDFYLTTQHRTQQLNQYAHDYAQTLLATHPANQLLQDDQLGQLLAISDAQRELFSMPQQKQILQAQCLAYAYQIQQEFKALGKKAPKRLDLTTAEAELCLRSDQKLASLPMLYLTELRNQLRNNPLSYAAQSVIGPDITKPLQHAADIPVKRQQEIQANLSADKLLPLPSIGLTTTIATNILAPSATAFASFAQLAILLKRTIRLLADSSSQKSDLYPKAYSKRPKAPIADLSHALPHWRNSLESKVKENNSNSRQTKKHPAP